MILEVIITKYHTYKASFLTNYNTNTGSQLVFFHHYSFLKRTSADKTTTIFKNLIILVKLS